VDVAEDYLPLLPGLGEHKLIGSGLGFGYFLALVGHAPGECIHRRRVPYAQLMAFLTVVENGCIGGKFAVAFCTCMLSRSEDGVLRSGDDCVWVKAVGEAVELLWRHAESIVVRTERIAASGD